MEKCNICEYEYPKNHIEIHLVKVHGVEGPSKPLNKENMHPNEAPVTNEYPVKKKFKNEMVDIDNLIERLLEVCETPGKMVQMTENEIRGLCLKSREIFLQQPILLELEAELGPVI